MALYSYDGAEAVCCREPPRYDACDAHRLACCSPEVLYERCSGAELGGSSVVGQMLNDWRLQRGPRSRKSSSLLYAEQKVG